MKNIILGLILLITTTGYSQKRKIQVLDNEKVFGKNIVDNSTISGFEYVFPDRIHKTFIDTATGLVTIQLRGLSKNGKWLDNKGYIVQYDIKNRKVLWSKKTAYQTSNLQQFNNTIIYTIGNKSYCLDVYTGNELWEVKNNIYFVDPEYSIGVGYRFKNSHGYSNILEGINLKNGNILWKRNLNREYGWNNVFYTNDSTMVVVAAGLHTIDIRTGNGWDYNTVTGKKDYKGTVAANALGAVSGLLTGTFLMSTGHNLVRDLVSNALVDSSNIYFASKEQLVKLDKQSGEALWKFPFSINLASKSSIFIKDSIIYMVNKGMAFMGYRQLDFGKPFFAAFNKQTGQKIFLSIINNKDGPILNFQVHKNEIYLVFKNRIVKYSIKTGAKIIEKEFPKHNFGELKYFVGNQVFITLKNGSLLNLRQSDSSKVFVYTNKDKILSLDQNLNIARRFDRSAFSICYQYTRGLKFIAKGENTYIIDGKGKTIAKIGVTSNAFLIDNTLYDTQGKSFITIDLTKIITN